jgi:hypothetical protein
MSRNFNVPGAGDVHDREGVDDCWEAGVGVGPDDWRQNFPDFATWDLWRATGWDAAPWTAGAWYRAGYSAAEAAASGSALPPG